MRRLRGLAVLSLVSAPGCSAGDILHVAAAGPIARTEYQLMLFATLIMLMIVVPVIVMAILFAWRFRAAAQHPAHDPEWTATPKLEVLLWGVPVAIITVLGTLVWVYTYRLDPYRPLHDGAPPIRVQAVAQDWKWLFIYPEQHVAAVNELVIPVDRDISFEITSDTTMSSFFIPALTGQIYAMAGMRTRLHLRADTLGSFEGRNAQFTGAGFPEQHFATIVTTKEAFERWIFQATASAARLDMAEYRRLAVPSIGNPPSRYALTDDDLFGGILAQFAPSHTVKGHH